MDLDSPQERGQREFNAGTYRIQNKSPLKSTGLKLLPRFCQGNSLLLKNRKPESPIKKATNTNSSIKNSPMAIKNSLMPIKNSPMPIKSSSMVIDDEEDLEVTNQPCHFCNVGYDYFGDALDVEDFNFDIKRYLNQDTPPVSPMKQDSFEESELDIPFEDLLHEYQMSDVEQCEDAHCDMPPIEDVPLPVIQM